MDALYDFLPVPSANSEEKPPRLYPKIVSKGTVTFEKLTEKIATDRKNRKPFGTEQGDYPCRNGRDRILDQPTPVGRIPGADREYRNGFGLAQS